MCSSVLAAGRTGAAIGAKSLTIHELLWPQGLMTNETLSQDFYRTPTSESTISLDEHRRKNKKAVVVINESKEYEKISLEHLLWCGSPLL
jgi:hypothetical protein